MAGQAINDKQINEADSNSDNCWEENKTEKCDGDTGLGGGRGEDLLEQVTSQMTLRYNNNNN